MSLWFKSPRLDLTSFRLETDRCIIVPFSSDGRVDIQELWEEFCRANKELYVSPVIPTYEQELEYVRASEEKMARWEEFENFILDRETKQLIGAWGIRLLETGHLNIWIWIRENKQWQWYASEVYKALLKWAWDNTAHAYLKHSLNPTNIWSLKLAEKFGWILQEEKTSREHIVYHIPLWESSKS